MDNPVYFYIPNTIDNNNKHNDMNNFQTPNFDPLKQGKPLYRNTYKPYLGNPRKRQRTTPEQTKILEDVFSRTPHPSASERSRLANELLMKPRSVQIWFQNRRAKEKTKPNRGEDSNSSDDEENRVNEENEVVSFESVNTNSNDPRRTTVASYGTPSVVDSPQTEHFAIPSSNYIPNIQQHPHQQREHYYAPNRHPINFDLTDINGRRNSIADISDSIMKRSDVGPPNFKEREASLNQKVSPGEFIPPLPLKPQNNNNNNNNYPHHPQSDMHQQYQNAYSNIQLGNKYMNLSSSVPHNSYTPQGNSTLHNSSPSNYIPNSVLLNNNNPNGGGIGYNSDDGNKYSHANPSQIKETSQEKDSSHMPPPLSLPVPRSSNQSLPLEMKRKLLGKILPRTTEDQKQQDNTPHQIRRNSDPFPDHFKSNSLLRSNLQNQFAKTVTEEGTIVKDNEKKFEPSYKRRISFLVSDPDTKNSSFWENREGDGLIHIGWSSLHPKRHSQGSIPAITDKKDLPSIENKSQEDSFVNIPKDSDTHNPRKKSFSKSYARLPSLTTLIHSADLLVNAPYSPNNINNINNNNNNNNNTHSIRENIGNLRSDSLLSLNDPSSLPSSFDLELDDSPTEELNEEDQIKSMNSAIEKRKIPQFKQLYEEFLSTHKDEFESKLWTPLHSAVKMGSLDCIQLILERSKIFLNTQEFHEQFSPLHMSSVSGNTQICSYLLEQGATIDLVDKRNRTPLYYSCVYGHLPVVDLLLNNGADIEFCDEEGHTALQAAALYGFTKIVVSLLQRGANINVRDNDSHTALYYAIRESHHDTAYSLRAAGAVDDFPSKKKKIE